MKRAIGGDFEAYGELYDYYVDRIYSYVFYQVRDKMTAEDITEEVFVRGWKAIRTCRGREDTFSAWLYRIAHNQVVDILRRQSRDQRYAAAVSPPIANPETEAEASLEKRRLLDNIARLPEAQRQLILLKFIDGADNEEVSRVMGKRPGAVRALQMRALAGLRQMLGVKEGYRGQG